MDKKVMLNIALVSFLVACNNSVTIPSTLTPSLDLLETPIATVYSEPLPLTEGCDSQNLVANLMHFTENSCKPPCFLGITPGKTHKDGINDILKKQMDYPCSIDNSRMRCSISGYDTINISIHQSTGIVDGFIYYPINHPLCLESIINYYGLPEYTDIWINTGDELNFAKVTLVYETFRTIITLEDVFGVNDKNGYEISRVTKVESIIAFNVDEYLEEKQFWNLHPWEGYGIYP